MVTSGEGRSDNNLLSLPHLVEFEKSVVTCSFLSRTRLRVSVGCLLIVLFTEACLHAFRIIVIALENTGLKYKKYLIDLAVAVV